MRWLLVVVAVLCTGLRIDPAKADGMLERVRAAGLVRCGVTTSGAGLAVLDADGHWQGFFADFCRAVAAAATGHADQVDFVELNSNNRFQALRDGTVDLVVQGATVTLHRVASQGVAFPAVYMFDGQGFMAHRSLGAQRLSEVGTATVCVIDGTTTRSNLESWIAASGSTLKVRVVGSLEGAVGAFFNHHCDLLTNDRISLFGQRRLYAPNPADYVVFPDVISKEPLAPVVKAGDRVWEQLVAWVLHAQVLAEEKGITASAAAAPTLSGIADPEARRLLGLTPGLGQGFALDDLWARRVIAQVGNYGEVFERHLGTASGLDIGRGPNALWSRGGLLYPPPLGE